MRILGFSKKWDKLRQPEFTTFRFLRRDKDWQVGEQVQIVFKPRSKEREVLGVAEIIKKEPRSLDIVEPSIEMRDYTELSEEEAIEDGFEDTTEMLNWMCKVYNDRIWDEPMNKLTLRWLSRSVNTSA